MQDFFSTSPEIALARDFFIALLLGLFIGIEREHQANTSGFQFGGLRTFTLCALFGALTAWLDTSSQTNTLFLTGLIGLSVLLSVAVYLEGKQTKRVPGLTSELAAIITYLLGGLILLGHAEIAVMIGVAMLALLAMKKRLHAVVRSLDRDDLIAGLKLLAASFVVLPLLPNHPVDPWEALNPYKLWWLVILISSLSLIGYAAVRMLGAKRGIILTGIFGGLVSSTAVTLSFARRSRETIGMDAILAVGILLAWSIMFVRIIIEVAVVNSNLLSTLIPPVIAMFVISAITLFWFFWTTKQSDSSTKSDKNLKDKNKDVQLKTPFSLTSAIQFGLVFAAILLVVKLFQLHMPINYMYAVAALAGAADVDAITLSLASNVTDDLSSRVAVLGILIAAWSNTVIKCGLVLALGSKALGFRLLIASFLIIMVGAGVFFIVT